MKTNSNDDDDTALTQWYAASCTNMGRPTACIYIPARCDDHHPSSIFEREGVVVVVVASEFASSGTDLNGTHFPAPAGDRLRQLHHGPQCEALKQPPAQLGSDEEEDSRSISERGVAVAGSEYSMSLTSRQ
ncbi:hypothetical protein FNV43_RR02257 [Rhamnella rubrinervis]|uniref:Uncharacterized protein n=1 Tax=Rhamnella rubrinervis TaxID=2594499 RepID=A0A8K0HSD8_9ROSA|nr:hypothetical protein FNV43_RR02257 [Rhamnella rubrinervis]